MKKRIFPETEIIFFEKVKLKLTVSIFITSIFIFSQNLAQAASSVWSDVGNKKSQNGLISAKKGAETNIAVSESGKIYVAFEDKDNKMRARVRMFDGLNWQDLGDSENPNGLVSLKRGGNPCLETKGSDVYVAFMDYADRQRARIKKWDGSSWHNIADSGHINGYVSLLRGFEPTLSFDKSGANLYVAFRDEIGGEREKVMKWSENSGWETVSDINNPDGLVSDFTASEADIKASKNDDSMYIAYEDFANHRKIRARKWNGSVWEDLSDENHPKGIVSAVSGFSPSIDTDSQGGLYLVYTGKNNRNTYMHKWDGSSWQDISGGIAVRGKTIESTIAIDNRDYVYLAYSQKAGGAWRVRAKIWDGTRWFNAKNGKSKNLSKGRGKGDPSLGTYGDRLYMSFTDARHKDRARVKMLNFE